MVDKELEDQEPIETDASGTDQFIKRRDFLKKAKRDLTEQELAHPAVQRFLIEEIERLEGENFDLADYRDKFHDSDKKIAVFMEKERQSTAYEIVSLSCLALGPLAIGAAPGLWSNSYAGMLSLTIGVVLLLTGLVARIVKR